MDAHEWNESLDRIISTIAEMINLLKNESRRWATSPIFSTPLPSPAAASPPPTSAPVPTLPPPKPATTPPIPSPASALKSPPQLAPSQMPTSPTITPIQSTQYLDASVQSDIILNSFKAISEFEEKFGVNYKVTTYFSDTQKHTTKCMGVIYGIDLMCVIKEHIREWRPPWRLVKTTPNAIGRVEWRPPWQKDKFSALEDKNDLKRPGLLCTEPRSKYNVLILNKWFTFCFSVLK
ncbi:hypothetical protein Hanom_Chr05g00417041 [Helianthus anomalus]